MRYLPLRLIKVIAPFKTNDKQSEISRVKKMDDIAAKRRGLHNFIVHMLS